MSNKGKASGKTIWIVLALVAIACAIACGIFMVVYSGANLQTEMHRTEERYNGVLETSPLENKLTVKHSGTYVIIADVGAMGTYTANGVPEDGFVTGVVLLNQENQVIFSCTGARLHAESKKMKLEKGEYKLVIETLAKEEDFNSFAKRYDCGEVIGPTFDFTGEDGRWDMRYIVAIEPIMAGSKGLGAPILCGLFFGIAWIIVLRMITVNNDKIAGEYDERQMAARGKAFRLGFWTAIVYFAVVALLHAMGIQLPMQECVVDIIGVLVAICVNLTICIWKDAYFALNENRGKLMVVFAIVTVMNLLAIIINFSLGTVVEDGKLGLGSLNIFCSAMIVYVLANLWAKEAKEKGEDAE